MATPRRPRKQRREPPDQMEVFLELSRLYRENGPDQRNSRKFKREERRLRKLLDSFPLPQAKPLGMAADGARAAQDAAEGNSGPAPSAENL